MQGQAQAQDEKKKKNKTAQSKHLRIFAFACKHARLTSYKLQSITWHFFFNIRAAVGTLGHQSV